MEVFLHPTGFIKAELVSENRKSDGVLANREVSQMLAIDY